MRVAGWELEWFLVDIAAIAGCAAWVPGGFRPLWEPLAFVLAAAVATLAGRGLSRLIGALLEPLARRALRYTTIVSGAGVRRCNALGRRVAGFTWSDVIAAYAYKADAYVHDVVCLAFVTPTGIHEFDERDAAWREIGEGASVHLAGSIPFAAWYLDVIREPFAPRFTSVYEKETAEATARAADLERLRHDVLSTGDDAASDAGDAVPLGRFATVRAYVALGTSGMVLAIAALLGAIGVLHGPASLVSLALVTVAYLVLSRAALFAVAYAVDRGRERATR
jgi:hypothetical protein